MQKAIGKRWMGLPSDDIKGDILAAAIVAKETLHVMRQPGLSGTRGVHLSKNIYFTQWLL